MSAGVTTRHRGGGHKRLYRIIDFKRDKLEVPAKVASIEYDPNRSARIALLHYMDGEKRYILAPQGLKVGDEVVSSAAADIKPGNRCPWRTSRPGTLVHNVEMKPVKGGQMARSAGSAVQLMAKEGKHAHLKLPPGKCAWCSWTAGPPSASSATWSTRTSLWGRPGASAGWANGPHVRGVAMNPVDHPHGRR